MEGITGRLNPETERPAEKTGEKSEGKSGYLKAAAEIERSVRASEIAVKLASGTYEINSCNVVKKWFGEK